MKYTSIQIAPETREGLQRLKAYKRETYDDVLNKLISLVPEGDEQGEFTEGQRAKLLASMAEHSKAQKSFEHRRELM